MSEIATHSMALQLLAELEKSGAITETSLQLPLDLPFDQFEAIITMLGQLHRTSAWTLGDALNFGEKVYGETYAQATVWSGLAEQTLINYASVCGRVPRSRRRKELPFSVHSEVAWLDPAEQKEWLGKAAAGRWTRAHLRDAMAPMREAKAAAEAEEKNRREDGGVRIPKLPPAVVSSICQCMTCGRRHRNDVDIDD